MTTKGRNWILIFVVLLFIIGIRAVTSKPAAPSPYLSGPMPYVIAHQGGDGLRPGNTLVAFEHARALGADVLEMDIRASRDGTLVVMHDASVDRTTQGSGLIEEMDLATIKQLDAAYHWPYERRAERPYRGQGIQVPTLAEVMQRFPDSRFNIEIKQFEPPVTDKLCSLLKDYHAQRRTLVAADDAETVLNFRKICPGVATSAFDREILYFLFFHKIGLVRLYHAEANAFQVPLEHKGITLVSPGIIHDARRRGMWVDAWTINEPQEMRRLIAMGIGGLITDYPDRALKLLGRDELAGPPLGKP